MLTILFFPESYERTLATVIGQQNEALIPQQFYRAASSSSSMRVQQARHINVIHPLRRGQNKQFLFLSLKARSKNIVIERVAR